MKAAANQRYNVRCLVFAAIVVLLMPEVSASQVRSNTDLLKVRTEISRLRKQLQRVRKEAKSTAQELQAIDLQTAILGKELQVAIEVIWELERRKAHTEAQIAWLADRIGRQKRYLASRLAALYRLGSLSYFRILLSLDQKTNPFEAAAMLSYVIHRDARAVAEFQQTRAKLATEYASLAHERERIDSARRLVAQKNAALARARREKTVVLARLEEESEHSTQRLAELEEKARRLERLFQLLYQHAQPGQPTGAKIGEFKGALEWPVQGTILEAFGPKRSARFATVTVSNGLKIEAPPGTGVRAVFEGTVVFSQWFKGYGNLVIVDHGNRIFSLYGNTRGNSVQVGDRIAPAQILAQVAENEEEMSGYLYFEIREDNEPVDPRTWLR